MLYRNYIEYCKITQQYGKCKKTIQEALTIE